MTADFRRVDQDSAGELVEQFYAELRRLAAARMKNERLDHTWQTTALVNELYIELVKDRDLTTISPINQADKAAFLGFSGHLMKRLLIHHARPLHRRAKRVSFDDSPEPAIEGSEALQEVDDALTRLAAIDPKFRSVVEMRVFEGLTSDEIAGKLNCSRRSVASYWNFARRWLEKEWAGNPWWGVCLCSQPRGGSDTETRGTSICGSKDPSTHFPSWLRERPCAIAGWRVRCVHLG